MKCQGDNPFASNMMQYLYGLNEKFVPEIDGATLDIITNLLISTKNIRYGAKPSIEGQYRIRQIIKADFSARLDIAEVVALSTLADLNRRIKNYYSPGLDINIRIEDWSGFV